LTLRKKKGAGNRGILPIATKGGGGGGEIFLPTSSKKGSKVGLVKYPETVVWEWGGSPSHSSKGGERKMTL